MKKLIILLIGLIMVMVWSDSVQAQEEITVSLKMTEALEECVVSILWE